MGKWVALFVFVARRRRRGRVGVSASLVGDCLIGRSLSGPTERPVIHLFSHGHVEGDVPHIHECTAGGFGSVIMYVKK